MLETCMPTSTVYSLIEISPNLHVFLSPSLLWDPRARHLGATKMSRLADACLGLRSAAGHLALL